MFSKSLKKCTTLLLALLLMIAMIPTAFAASPDVTTSTSSSGTITITGADGNAATGSKYKLIKLYTATPDVANNRFNYAATAVNTSGKTMNDLNAMTATELATWAETMGTSLKDTAGDYTDVASGTAVTVADGCYLVIQTAIGSDSGRTFTKPFLVSVPEVSNNAWNFNVTAKVKDSTADITKKIVEDEKRVDSNDKNIGDIVNYEVTSTIPKYASDATNITYSMTDTFSKGLTFDPASVVVKTNTGAILEKDKDYTVSAATAETDGSNTYKITYDYNKIKEYDSLVVTYSAELNENANIGAVGNPNKVKLTYTNNPSDHTDHDTEWHKVITYTYGIAVHKTDGDNDNADLAGATFTLKQGDKVIGSYTYDNDGNPTKTTGAAVSDDNGMIYFPGLDEGTYTLEETKAPDGYNMLSKAVTIVITSTKNDAGQPTGQATYTVDGTASTPTTTVGNSGNLIFMQVNIVNHKNGTTMPNTGGMGTEMMLYGGIAIALIGVIGLCVYTSRKRKHA